MVFLSGNQVTQLVNRMEVLSEKLHPSWQCATCVQLETSVSRISMLSPLSLHNHCCYLFISQKCNGRHFIWLLILMLKQPKAAISADFVCLPLLLSSLFMFSDSRRYVEGCHLNCWQDVPLIVNDLISCLLCVPQRHQWGNDCVPQSCDRHFFSSCHQLVRHE